MNETAIYTYTALTTIGLTIKCLIWLKVTYPEKLSKAHTATTYLIYIQLIQSLTEYMIYFVGIAFSDDLAIIPLTIYYSCMSASLFLIPYIILLIFTQKQPKWLFPICFIIYSFFIMGLVASDLILAGARYNGISFTRIPGEFYWAFQSLVFISFICSIGLLIYFKITQGRHFVARIKISNFLLCYLLLAAYSLTIIIIMIFFDNINAVGILPILMSIFLLGLAHTVTKDNFLDFSYWIPFSKRHKLVKRLAKPFITVSEDGVGIDIKKEYDSIAVQHALELFNNNQSMAAKWLSISQASVSRKIKP